MVDDDLELMAGTLYPPSQGCRTCWALTMLPDETAALMGKVLAGTAPHEQVSAAFVRRDLPVGISSVSRHRSRCLDA